MHRSGAIARYRPPRNRIAKDLRPLMSFPRLALAAFFLLLSAFSAQAQFTVEPSPPPAEEARPGYGALADILEDEAARRRLIEDLRRLAAGEGAA